MRTPFQGFLSYGRFEEDYLMTRITPFSNPLLLGFETMEKTLDRLGNKSGDGYPPYNIERLATEDQNDRLRTTLAVAGFSANELDVTVEDFCIVVSHHASSSAHLCWLTVCGLLQQT